MQGTLTEMVDGEIIILPVQKSSLGVSSQYKLFCDFSEWQNLFTQGCLELYDFSIKQPMLFFRSDSRNSSERLID